MTKFDTLKVFLVRKGTFRFGDVNKHFGLPVSDINSYTTYLNTLRHAGLVKQTARGQYKVTDPARLRVMNHSDVKAVMNLKRAKLMIKDLEETNHKWVRHSIDDKINLDRAKLALAKAKSDIASIDRQFVELSKSHSGLEVQQDAFKATIRNLDSQINSLEALNARLINEIRTLREKEASRLWNRLKRLVSSLMSGTFGT